MTRFIAGKVTSSVVTVIGASFVAFILMRVLPGSPVRLIVGPLASQAEVENTTKALGLNQPIPVQYWDYISNFLRGHCGPAREDPFGHEVPSITGTGFVRVHTGLRRRNHLCHVVPHFNLG
jgi:ABC-type dipeptide/oligopeptide/nickel transport system permease component